MLRAGRAMGFTLVETMVAIAILGLTVAALLQLVSSASDTTLRDRSSTIATALAEQRMEALLSAGAEKALLPDDRVEPFDPPFERFQGRVRVEPVPDRDLVEIEVEVTDPAGGRVVLATRAPTSENAAP